MNLSRDISVEPPNLLDPAPLADPARDDGRRRAGSPIEVLDQDRMRQLGMGALLGVAQGSAEPPALIVIQYKPENAPRTTIISVWSAKASPSIPAASPSSPLKAWRR